MIRTKDLFLQHRIEEEYEKEQLYIKQQQLKIMAGTNTEEKNLGFYNLKSKADSQNEPHWARIGKVNDKWETVEKFNTMKGRIIGASIKSRPDEKGKVIKSFVLIFHDGKEESNVNMNHTNLTYSIINSLANAHSFEDEISIQVKKTTDGKYYNAHGYVKNNGDDIKWLVHMKDTPRAEAVMVDDPSNPGAKIQLEVNGDRVFDKTKMQAYWEDFFTKNVIPKVKNSTPVSQTDSAKAFIEEMNTDNPPVEGDEPF